MGRGFTRIYKKDNFCIAPHRIDIYLQINSCGFQNSLPGYTVIRKKGRYDYHILLIGSGVCEVLHKDERYTLTEGNLIIYAPGATGTTPIKYQNDIRLKTSCEILSSTKYTIADIAFNCGFNNPLYYSRIFKKKYNVTPTEYRFSTSTT